MREMFKHDTERNQLVPGRNWVEAVNIARSQHNTTINSGLYANEVIRSLGSAMAGYASVTKTKVDVDLFAEAAVPPMTQLELNDLNWGFRTIMSEDMLGVEV